MLKKSLLLMALAGWMLSGCADFNCCDSSVITVNPNPIMLKEATGNTATIEVTSSVVWRVVAKPDWVTLSMDGPAGVTTLTLTAAPNTPGAVRSDEITFQAANGDQATVKVTQIMLSIFAVTQDLYNVSSQNVETAIKEDQDFITKFTPESGFNLPATITITMGGTILTAGTDYTYNSVSGELTIPKVSGDVTITVACGKITYPITYDANGGDAPSLPAPQVQIHDVSLTLSATIPTRTGHLFTEWNTQSDGLGTAYAPGATYTANATQTLYAQWVDSYSVTVNYITGQSNTTHGALSVDPVQTAYASGSSVTVKASFTKTPYNAVKWVATNNRNADVISTDADYTFTIMGNTVLYAVFNGNGASETTPVEMATAIEMERLATRVNAGGGAEPTGLYYKLIADIDLSGYGAGFNDSKGWIPIGRYLPAGLNFTGHFDGAYHTVSNLTINDEACRCGGLFGYVVGGTVKNLGALNVNIKGNDMVGGLVGYLRDGTATNCYTTGAVNGNYEVGGLMGGIMRGRISNCYAESTVTCPSRVDFSQPRSVGGLVGSVGDNSSVTNCYTTGAVSGSVAEGVYHVGGVVGWISESRVTNCYAMGAVSGYQSVGGVVGTMYTGTGNFVVNCVALNTSVRAEVPNVGRVAGSLGTGVTLNSNWSPMGMSNGGGIVFPATIGSTDVNGSNCAPTPTEGWWKAFTNWNTTAPYTEWKFGTNDANPWLWSTTLNRPILYWE